MTYYEWVRKGECNQCGDCCIRNKLESKEDFERLKMVLEMSSKANPGNKELNDKIIERITKARGKVCVSLVPKPDGTANCKVHKTRPEHCIQFPKAPLDIRNLDRCSYYFVKVKRKGKAKPAAASVTWL